jgi:DNA-binding NarL/FixJ family response regulator
MKKRQNQQIDVTTSRGIASILKMISKASVLIVDDSAVMRSALRRLFKPHKEFEILGEAVNGEDALDKARSFRPDLIILDLSMPKMNGLEAARRLKQILPDVRLMLYTSHFGTDVAKLAEAAGINRVVCKAESCTALILSAQSLMAS